MKAVQSYEEFRTLEGSRALEGPPLSSSWWTAEQAAALCLLPVRDYD